MRTRTYIVYNYDAWSSITRVNGVVVHEKHAPPPLGYVKATNLTEALAEARKRFWHRVYVEEA